MSRRKKLSRHDRKKRESKRQLRAENRNKALVRYREALRAYIRAVTHEGRNPERCVCEKCGLEQAYETGEWDLTTGLVTIFVCEGWEYMGCGGEFCWVPGDAELGT